MGFLTGLLVAGLVIGGFSGGPAGVASLSPTATDPGGALPPTALPDDLSVDPAPDAWVNTSRPTVVVRILDTSFVPLVERTTLLLDGQRLVPEWDATLRSLRGTPDESLSDGVHQAEVGLQDGAGRELRAAWNFSQDTLPPRVDFDAVPPEADRRVFAINGTVAEPNLVDVRVNGFAAIIQGDRFSVPVLLWPGRNDLLAVARDEANNAGYAAGVIAWLPASPANVSYVTVFHGNASFTVRLPTGWEVEADADLEGGLRAQIVARQPEILDLRATIAIVSRPVGTVMSQALLLTILEDSIRRIAADSTIDVVSRPHGVDLASDTVSAQFSVVETLQEGPRVFRLVTGFWSQRLGRIWLVLGSVSTETVEAHWHAIQTAEASFRVVAPPEETQTGHSPRAAIDRAFFVTVGAIVLLLVVFGIALRSIRVSPRGYARFSPPRGRSRAWLARWDSRQSRIWRRR